MNSVKSLNQGFRSHYIDYAQLTAQLKAWAARFPEVCRLSSLGTSPEGRQLWLLTVGRDPERVRPAVWVDANMHAIEYCGTNVALAIAEDMLSLLVDDAPHQGLSAPVRERLDDVLFYVMPRVSPDGCESVLRTGRYVRSVPRDERVDRGTPRFVTRDVDGDGQSLMMRMEDATGEFVEATDFPGLMVAREVDDEGPFYKLYPEGHIEPWDGHTIPSPETHDDNAIDLNRNFPNEWQPPHLQQGAGAFPVSEPESRAIVEFASRHPEIIVWTSLHTFGGVFIRPPGTHADAHMHAHDLEVFRQVGAWAQELTGYPMVSGFEEFTYEIDRPLHGECTDYAYVQRGALSYVVELWDLFHRLELPRPRRFVDYYVQLGHADLIKFAQWDRDFNQGRTLRPWRPFQHPQLGQIEVGGVDLRVGLWNPPPEELAAICEQHAHHFSRVASLVPAVRMVEVERRAVAEGVTELTVQVENQGYLGTYGLASAKVLAWNEPLHAQIEVEGAELIHRDDAVQRLGHLDGWGRGRYGAGNLTLLRSRGSTGRARLRVLIRGHGRVVVRVCSCRTGSIERAIDV